MFFYSTLRLAGAVLVTGLVVGGTLDFAEKAWPVAVVIAVGCVIYCVVKAGIRVAWRRRPKRSVQLPVERDAFGHVAR